jgi:hypothetical protein
LVGGADCGFCARAGTAASINAVSESVRSMMRFPLRRGLM